MDAKTEQLASIVEQMVETVIVSTETVEQLSGQLTHLAQQIQQQEQQIVAMGGAVQTLTDNQTIVINHIAQLTETLERIAASLENTNASA